MNEYTTYSMTLYINDVEMAGAVMEIPKPFRIFVWDIWWKYCDIFKKKVAEGRPVSVVRKFATWSVNGEEIDEPQAVYLKIGH